MAAPAESDVFTFPVAVRYTFVDDMTGPIDTALTRLERQICPGRAAQDLDPYTRLRRIGGSHAGARRLADANSRAVIGGSSASFRRDGGVDGVCWRDGERSGVMPW